MNSYLGIPFLRIAAILVLSLVFKAAFPQKIRDALVPWCFAGMLAHSCLVPFVTGLQHFGLLILYFVEMAILLGGINLKNYGKNPPLMAFFLFWGYLMLSSLWCKEPWFATTWWISTLLELLLVGYFTGIWVLQTPDGLRRLLTPTALIGCLFFIYFWKYDFIAELDAGGRGVLDQGLIDEGLGTNVNQIGLSVAPVVASMTVMAFQITPKTPYQRFVQLMSVVTLFVSSYMLLRTGSRNACLVFFPCGYFIVKSLQSNKKVFSILLIAFLVCGLVYLGKNTLQSDEGYIRAFLVTGSERTFDKYEMSSGRWYEYEMYLSNMSTFDWFFGQGAEIGRDASGKLGVGGCLSVYVTLLRFVGIAGLVLLGRYFLSMWHSSKRLGLYGQVAFLFFMTWAITGIAEGQGIRRGHAVRLLQGMSLALCSNLNARRRDELWYGTLPPSQKMGARR